MVSLENTHSVIGADFEKLSCGHAVMELLELVGVFRAPFSSECFQYECVR